MLLAPLTTTSIPLAIGSRRGTASVVVGLFVGRLVQVIRTSEPTG
jgi:hypothetical protein